MIDGVVAPVDQLKLLPAALMVDVPHPLVTVVTGADGTVVGAAVTEDAVLVHPETV